MGLSDFHLLRPTPPGKKPPVIPYKKDYFLLGMLLFALISFFLGLLLDKPLS
jgi:hypothetical protein